jgi:tRNA threonylcarbamoyladenosine biosynthesis protein TsaE
MIARADLGADVEFRLAREADTARLGAAIARGLRAGEAVCLDGPLGAGKSVLARALIRTLAPAERDVPSPTFTLVQFYQGAYFPIAHFDLYRLTAPEEAFEIGLDEALADGAAVIEWASRLEGQRPPDRLDVDLIPDGRGRRARLTARGSWRGRALDL